MSEYTIDDFWTHRLGQASPPTASLIPGWFFIDAGLATFKEAPLTLSDALSADDDPTSSSILLVSAAGAVGKSTLAREIAFSTGSVYVDLAKAAPVGDNTLSGGLLKSGLHGSWKDQSISLLIDGLDEARLKVTQEAFEAFLQDVADLQQGVPCQRCFWADRSGWGRLACL